MEVTVGIESRNAHTEADLPKSKCTALGGGKIADADEGMPPAKKRHPPRVPDVN
jgi:hypothetical protein